MITADQRAVVAAFTNGMRLHLGLTQAGLARQIGIRPDQVSKAESARPCGAAAWRELVKFNNLETHGYG